MRAMCPRLIRPHSGPVGMSGHEPLGERYPAMPYPSPYLMRLSERRPALVAVNPLVEARMRDLPDLLGWGSLLTVNLMTTSPVVLL